ncbi:Uma2 family endonuclease [Gemmata sp.]|uniref:Uma2 family endonuclease n=1 Tax=Gemmata sp. TaxID=1914242 RepID=UPI003F6E93AD
MPVEDGDIWRISVDRYHRMVASGVITPDDRVELLEGVLVNKMSKSPPHRIANGKARRVLEALLPTGWYLDTQEPISLDDSEPEPDVVIVRGRTEDYATAHPTPAVIPLVIEVADSSLRRDREDKRRIYARNGIAVYWIVNVADRLVDVFSGPSGPVLTPDYATTTTYRPGDAVPVVLAGTTVGSVNVSDLLP